MSTLHKGLPEQMRTLKQRGLVLFFALIALLVLSLAAAALVRSVDTSTLIAGNLAFRQAATTSADAGVEAAMAWLAATEAANTATSVLNNTPSVHPFNTTIPTSGYYSNVTPALDLFADATWNASTIPEVTDSSGNNIRYIIQRMCRNADLPVQTADCLFSGALEDKNGQAIPLPQEICSGPGCPVAGQTPQIRITSRVTGPKNTVSYVQAFVY
jgi:hypothetical protein